MKKLPKTTFEKNVESGYYKTGSLYSIFTDTSFPSVTKYKKSRELSLGWPAPKLSSFKIGGYGTSKYVSYVLLTLEPLKAGEEPLWPDGSTNEKWYKLEFFCTETMRKKSFICNTGSDFCHKPEWWINPL